MAKQPDPTPEEIAAAEAAAAEAAALAPPDPNTAGDPDAIESNELVDETPQFSTAAPEVGQFVGVGITQVSIDVGEWIVDPVTGCITGPV